MSDDVTSWNEAQSPEWRAICDRLAEEIDRGLPGADRKIWHGGPVWFLNGNPITGYWVRKRGVQMLFWSGQSFDEPGLEPEGTFKAAQVHYLDADAIDTTDLQRWLGKARVIQWDYKNIAKRRGVLERLV